MVFNTVVSLRSVVMVYSARSRLAYSSLADIMLCSVLYDPSPGVFVYMGFNESG
jgi:hypothetical protein